MLPNNTTFDVYRGYAPATPYNPPQRPAVLAGLQGYLHQHVRNGRFGYYPSGEQAPLYWTTVLDVPIGTDVRDAYNTQLNADTIQNGDTVMAYDYPIPGTCCAFVVSFVQRRNRGHSSDPQSIDFIRLYLDRAQPDWKQGCPDPTAGGVDLCGCTGIPQTLYLTLSGAGGGCSSCLNGTYTLTYQIGTNDWRYTGDACGVAVIFRLYCNNGTWSLDIGTSVDHNTTSSSGSKCDPLALTFHPVAVVADICSTPGSVNASVSQ